LIDSCRINDSNFEDYLPLMEHTHGITLSRRLVFTIQFPVTITLNNDSAAITANYHADMTRKHRLNFRRMRLYTHFLLRAIPRQGWAVCREARIMNT